MVTLTAKSGGIPARPLSGVVERTTTFPGITARFGEAPAAMPYYPSTYAPPPVETPKHRMMARWLVARPLSGSEDQEREAAEAAHLREHFDGLPGTAIEIKALSPEEKLAVLEEMFGHEAARTGVAFVKGYQEFEEKMVAPYLTEDGAHREAAQIKVNAEFVLEGVVQQCGTRGWMQRLVALTAGMKLADVRNLIEFYKISDDTTRQGVRIRGISLGALSLLLGLISPANEESPAIYLGMDIGWIMEPHNFVIARLNCSSFLVPPTFHLYLLNVRAIENLKITHVDNSLPIEEGLTSISSALREMAREFAEAL